MTIQEYQRQDLPLRQRVEAEPTKFKKLNIENATIIVRITDHDDNNNTNNELTDRSAINSNDLSLLNRSAAQNNELNIQYNKNNYNDKIYNSNRSAVDGTLRRAEGDNRSAIASNINSNNRNRSAISDNDQNDDNIQNNNFDINININKNNEKEKQNEQEKPFSIPWKIALPNNMLTNLVSWHHKLTMHTESAERTLTHYRRDIGTLN